MAPNKRTILIVDDEASMREVLEIVLQNDGYTVLTESDVAAATARLEKESVDCVLTDLRMGSDRAAGMELLDWLQENMPELPAVMMTAYGSVETAIDAMKRGARDYIMKPFKNDEIRITVKRAIEQRDLVRENLAFRKEQAQRGNIDGVLGQSEAIQEVREMVRRVAQLPSTVAIHGESGTGKELVARAIHQLSDRRDKPFVAINCGGIPETLLESELFGHKKGAFTGAHEDKEGLFVVANHGTLFLDEVGEMPLSLQVKLLRVLDNSEVMPLGGARTTKVDVRILSATNRDLEAMSKDGGFREDLFYRLNVIPVTVPPLRDRDGDACLLARHFAQAHGEKLGRGPLSVSPEAEAVIADYQWPGNVRELGNVLERAVALCRGETITPDDLPPNIRNAAEQTPIAEEASTLPASGIDLEALIADMETKLIEQALEKSKYSQKKAAQLLGLSSRSLRYRLKKYNLDTT